MDERIKYLIAMTFSGAFMGSAYFFPAETFLVFTAGWLFIIPAVFIAYMIYGYVAYKNERRHRIQVTLMPTEAMKSLIHHEMDMRRGR